MNRKGLYLFLALLLPGLIFLFLKKFGKNEFDIPYFYASADSLNAICNTHYASPYSLPDSVLVKMGWKGKEASLIIIGKAQEESGLKRLPETFDVNDFDRLIISPEKSGDAVFGRWTTCVFFVAPPWDLVLVDRHRRIRGYYASTSRDDVDRLILEMKILLKKY